MKLRSKLRQNLAIASLLTLLAPWAPLARGEGKTTFPNRRPSVDPNWVGEKHQLTISYLGFTGLHVEIEVLPTETINGRKSYHARARAQLAKLLDLFYTLDDMAETWIDYEGIFSHRFHLMQKESKFNREAWEEHDAVKGETTYRNSLQKKDEKPENSRSVAAIPRFAQDSFSAFFYLRSLPLDVGNTYRVPVVSECNTMEVQSTVMGADLIEERGETTQALQIRLEKLDGKGNPIPGQSNLVWLSNDERRILLRLDVTTRFGHVVGKLKDYTPGTPARAP